MQQKKKYKRFTKILIVSLFLSIYLFGMNSDTDSQMIQDNSSTPRQPFQNTGLAHSSTSETILGENISSPVNITSYPAALSRPKAAINENNDTFFVWTANIAGEKTIQFRIFYYANQSWSPIRNLSEFIPSGGSNYNHFDPEIVVSGNYAYVVWTYDYGVLDGGQFKVYFSRLHGDVIVTNPVLLTLVSGSTTFSESSPTIQISKYGDIFVVTRFSELETVIQDKVRVHVHWNNETDYSIARWKTYDITDYSKYANSEIFSVKSKLDLSNNLHVAFIGQIGSTRAIYYAANTTDLYDDGGDSYFGGYDLGATGTFYNVTNNCTPSQLPTDIIMNGIGNNLYLGWSEVNQTNGASYDLRIFNKTLSDQYFDNNECFKVDTTYARYATFNFDSQENMLIGWYDNDVKEIYYVRNLSQTENDKIVLTDTTNPNLPFIEVGPNSEDIFILYINNANEVKFQQIDRNIPYASSNALYDGGDYKQILEFEVVYEPDTRIITYEYSNDTDFNGIPDGSWALINSTLRNESNMTASLSATWDLTNLDLASIIIRINATDKNFLSQSLQYFNISIDSNQPYRVEFNQIYDTFGNDGEADEFCKGVISISYYAEDLISQVEYVELRNGTIGGSNTILASNSSGESGDNSIMLWDSTLFSDGYYSSLFLVAYDYAGWSNTSEYFAVTILVDNTVPVFSATNVQNGSEYSGSYVIGFTTVSDTHDINCTWSGNTPFGYRANKPLKSYLESNATKISPTFYSLGWSTANYLDSEGGFAEYDLNGLYILNFTATDIHQNSHSIYYSVLVDNIAPTPIIVSPLAGDVGLRVGLNISTDNDTISAEIGFRKGTAATHHDLEDEFTYINITDSLEQDGDNLRYFQDFDLTSLGYEFTDDNRYITISIESIDNQGLIGSTKIYVFLENEIPLPAAINRITREFNQTAQDFNIVIRWLASSDLSGVTTEGNTEHYLIYRSRTDFNTNDLNNMAIIERLELLGSEVGEGFCVGKVVNPNTTDGYLQWIDYGVSVNTYYYAIIAVNEYGNPSDISDSMKIELPVQNPEKEINLQDLQLMPYIFAGLMVGMLITAVVIGKSAKKVKTDRKVREKYEQILEAEYDVFSEETKSMSDRLDDIESLMDQQIAGGDAILREKKKEDFDIDSILEEDVGKEDDSSFFDSSGIRKCPECGWALSSTATKCPRCGRSFF